MKVALRLSAFLFLATPCYAQDIKEKQLVEAPKAKDGVGYAAAGKIKVDGKPEKAWDAAPKLAVTKSVASLLMVDEKEMATAQVQFLWDQDTLYTLWRVKDGKLNATGGDPWEQDSVELFLDQNNKKSYDYQEDDAQYRVNIDGEISGQGTGYDAELLKAAATKTKTGYIIETSLKIKHVELKPGLKMGMDLQVNDDAGDGSRSAAAKWYHDEDDSWENASTFGTLILK